EVWFVPPVLPGAGVARGDSRGFEVLLVRMRANRASEHSRKERKNDRAARSGRPRDKNRLAQDDNGRGKDLVGELLQVLRWCGANGWREEKQTMRLTDPVADMLTRVRNALQARHQKVDVPASRLKVEIARILKEEGYISNFK